MTIKEALEASVFSASATIVKRNHKMKFKLVPEDPDKMTHEEYRRWREGKKEEE